MSRLHTIQLGNEDPPLRADALQGAVHMILSARVLLFATETHPDYDDSRRDGQPNIKVTDIDVFANEVALQLNAEDDAGETPLTRLIDDAIASAIESGCEGVDHDPPEDDDEDDSDGGDNDSGKAGK